MAADRQDGRPVLPGQQHKQEIAAFSLGVPTNPLQASKMLQAWSASADPGKPGQEFAGCLVPHAFHNACAPLDAGISS